MRTIKKDIFKPLDKYEDELMKAIESGEFVEITNQQDQIKKYTNYFRQAFKKNKRITIRVDNRDIKEIQEKAIETGIPYQTLISAILHKFAKGKMQIGV